MSNGINDQKKSKNSDQHNAFLSHKPSLKNDKIKKLYTMNSLNVNSVNCNYI